MGADEPIARKHILESIKNPEKYLGVYLDILYSSTKFREKIIFFMAYAK
jgi:hypothetical protein